MAPSVVLVHDWLLTWRGGEKVLEAIAELFPEAPIATLFHDPKSMAGRFPGREIITSYLDRLPGARSRHRQFLPLMPHAIRSLELGPADLVISSSHCVAKGVRVPRGAKHLSYVHAPLRYMWDRFDDYFGPGRASVPVRLAATTLRPALQRWDVESASSVDAFLANSAHVAGQVRERYGRVAQVIHPPVELERFAAEPLQNLGQGGYFLCVGALAPYKRIDVAIEASRRAGFPLWIAGQGQSAHWLRGLPPSVKVVGPVSDESLPALYRGARALIFPGVEDFGITPLEALACGRPVIALGQGGALETLAPGLGHFFPAQTVESLLEALSTFEAFERHFEPSAARAHALRFSKTAFQQRFRQAVDEVLGIGGMARR